MPASAGQPASMFQRGLVEAPGDQVPAGQVHGGGPGEHLGQRAVAAQRRPEVCHLFIDRKLPGSHAVFYRSRVGEPGRGPYLRLSTHGGRVVVRRQFPPHDPADVLEHAFDPPASSRVLTQRPECRDP